MAYDYDLVVMGCGPAGEKGAAQAAVFRQAGSGRRGRSPSPVEPVCTPARFPRRRCARPRSCSRATASASSTASRSSSTARTRCRGSCPSRDGPSSGGGANSLEPRAAQGRLPSRRRAASSMRTRCELRSADGERTITGEVFLVATGSRPFQPNEIDFADPDIDDSDTILELDSAARETLTILGGGRHRLRVRVHVRGHGREGHIVEAARRLLTFLDSEIADALRQAMVDLGIDLRLGDQRTRSVAPRRATRDRRPSSHRASDIVVGKAALRRGAQRRDGGARPREDRRQGQQARPGRGRRRLQDRACRTSTRPATSSAFPRSPRPRWSRRASRSATRSARATRSR